jgi:uncharacterized hydrophobic protein (TIGR00341 family)
MKIIEVIADEGHVDTIKGIADQFDIIDLWFGPGNDDGRVAARLLVDSDQRQNVLDTLQSVLQSSENARIVVIPIELTLPKVEVDEDNERKKSIIISREEIFSQVEKGVQLNANFIMLVIFSAIVAAIGMLENNVAVIVGAMVIAPLLGPNIAFSLGTSLGETDLVFAALKAVATGILLAVITGFIIGLVWPGSLDTAELMLRTDAFYSGTAIALASGAAASLSLITGTSSVLVGVMVAVALMPPAVTIGLMLSIQDIHHATGAALLLAVNIVCINLSAKLVFLYRGIKPRTWLEARKAKQSMLVYGAIWVTLLILLIAMIYLRHRSL